MDMDLLKVILTSSGIVISLVTTLITIIAKNSKNSKLAKKATALLAITEAIQTFIAQAERIINFDGSNKKEWVMTKVNQFCIEKKIVYDEAKVDEILERMIAFSKDVNSKEGEL